MNHRPDDIAIGKEGKFVVVRTASGGGQNGQTIMIDLSQAGLPIVVTENHFSQQLANTPSEVCDLVETIDDRCVAAA